MTISVLYWVLFIVGLVFFGVGWYRDRTWSVPNLLFWILLFLLGWAEFGSPIKG